MTAIRVVAEPEHVSSEVNAWLDQHHEELVSRARACFAWYRPDEREEAVAEVMAMTVAAAHQSAAKGRLERLTPYHCVRFGAMRFRCGRRMTGYSSTDVMSEAAHCRRRARVYPLEDHGFMDEPHHLEISEAFADRKAADPAEATRQRLDYAQMLDDPAISAKARATFMFLASTHGQGRQTRLAAELMVTEGRITQLKGELAKVFMRYGYGAPQDGQPAKK